jgi:hypothetical protein
MVLNPSFGNSALIPLKDLSRPASQDGGNGHVTRAPADSIIEITLSIAVQVQNHMLSSQIYTRITSHKTNHIIMQK